ncbi:unnamed protein product [marine sediment metagenome]|uniref:SF3 helicase domain-containing protein n=1 Tax=marine sediment metagenome TaxID=412755 RepID=X1AIU4_9ZZZZ
MWIYKKEGNDEGIYVPQGRTYIQQICRNILSDAYTNKIYNLVIAKVEADTYEEIKEFFKEEHLDLVAVKNGILNLRTRELVPFSSKYRFFSKHPLTYDKDKDCPIIKEFFKSLFKQAKKEILVMQEIFGYILYREYFIEKAFMFLGIGRNGKGKTIMLMKKFIGEDNTSEIPLEDLEKDIFAQGELFKKNANLCGDLSKGALYKSGKFKSLTGRDPINAARKFLTRISFINFSKMIFAANELPLTFDLTPAFFNRWIILDFPFTFLSQKDIDIIPENERDNIKLRDPDIIEKIATPNEMSGLLNWSLDGLDKLFKNKTFSYSPSTEETKKKWLRRSDSCLAFVMDKIETCYDEYIIKSEFKSEYVRYCQKHRISISGDKMIKHVITVYVGGSDDRISIENTQKSVWGGIRFKKDKNYFFPMWFKFKFGSQKKK